MAHLHWRCFYGDIAGDSDTRLSLLTCFGHLGRLDRDRIISIYVVLPKVAKARKLWLLLLQVLSHNLCQCKYSFSCLKQPWCLPYLLWQLGSFLFVLLSPRWPRQVKVDLDFRFVWPILATNLISNLTVRHWNQPSVCTQKVLCLCHSKMFSNKGVCTETIPTKIQTDASW
jgi:hypothetical protein